MSITSFLKEKGFGSFEGNVEHSEAKMKDLISLTSKPNLSVMEIGFNAGNSAELFLKNNKNLKLLSFDLVEHEYVLSAKKYIDYKYPNRHNLIVGDSTITVPKFITENKNAKFDIIFIDGGHSYDVAKADLINCMPLAHKHTIVILDDTIYTENWEKEWTVEPTKVWNEFLKENKIIGLNKKDYSPGYGMSWGKYVL